MLWLCTRRTCAILLDHAVALLILIYAWILRRTGSAFFAGAVVFFLLSLHPAVEALACGKPEVKAKAKAAPASHLRYCDAYLTQAGCPRHATGECTLWHVPEEVKHELIAQERKARQAAKAQP